MIYIRAVLTLCLLAVPTAGKDTAGKEVQDLAANPIRKVVTMLQVMKKKIIAEGKKEEEMYEKFMCYCKNGKGDLEASIAEAESSSGGLPQELAEKIALLAQLKEEIKRHRADKAEAMAAIADATAIREKEAAAFAKEAEEYRSYIASIKAAYAAIEKGMSGAFLQTFLHSQTVSRVLAAVEAKSDMNDGDRQELLSFFSGQASTGEESPGSAEIVGILKQMADDFAASLKGISEDESEKVKDFEALIAAKKKEIATLIAQIEPKTVRIGELGMAIVQLKADMTDSEATLAADKKFLANLEADCDTKAKEWEEIQKTRSEELMALAETIKLLNDDDALDLFKKTLPSASSAFIQVTDQAKLKAKALAVIEKSMANSQKLDHPRLDFIALALRGKKVGFEKVIKMIDDMVKILHTEQAADDAKKDYCEKKIDKTEEALKALKGKLSDLEAKIEDTKGGIETLATEIADLEKGIKELDKSVAEATEQRKAEHVDFQELLTSNGAAKELLNFAKNRLNKFYNPQLYAATTFVQVSKQTDHAIRSKVDPGPAPEAPGPYKTKAAESSGVIAMIEKLIKGLDKEVTEAKVAETNAQEEYEELMEDSQAKRAADTTSITEKESAKASMEGDLEAATLSKADSEKEAAAKQKFLASLHAECDWLVQYYDVRKSARAGEINALQNAKSVLAGADY